MCENGVHAKETKADIAEHVFSLSIESANQQISESPFEDLSFRSFLKASD